MSLEEQKQLLQQVHQVLLQVYGKGEWRDPLAPVDELVCTILSQNTNDVNRDKAFTALINHFPDWESVRDADPQELMEVIRIAGLANQKGPNIQSALQAVTQERGEISLEFLRDLPVEEARQWLTHLKGVGPKTAAIVLLFAMDIPAFPVDTHIYRVSGRIGLRPQALDVAKTHTYLENLAPPETYYALHLNLIKLGREVCQARKPLCFKCPVSQLCLYHPKTSA